MLCIVTCRAKTPGNFPDPGFSMTLLEGTERSLQHSVPQTEALRIGLLPSKCQAGSQVLCTAPGMMWHLPFSRSLFAFLLHYFINGHPSRHLFFGPFALLGLQFSPPCPQIAWFLWSVSVHFLITFMAQFPSAQVKRCKDLILPKFFLKRMHAHAHTCTCGHTHTTFPFHSNLLILKRRTLSLQRCFLALPSFTFFFSSLFTPTFTSSAYWNLITIGTDFVY